MNPDWWINKTIAGARAMKLACCWRSLLPPQPTIHLVLRSSKGQYSFNFQVDTAFSGYLSFQRKAIEKLGLEYLGNGSFAQYFKVEIPFYLCEAWVVTPNKKPVFQITRKPSDNHLEFREWVIDLESRSRKFLPIIKYILHWQVLVFFLREIGCYWAKKGSFAFFHLKYLIELRLRNSNPKILASKYKN